MEQAAVSVLVLLSAGGCTDKVEVDVPAYDEGDDVPIVIRASDEMLGTATRTGDGTITDGQVKNREDFLFTYPAKDGKMNSLPCRFDNRGDGYVYISEDKTLTRGDILFKKDKEGKEIAEVYLDNLVGYPVQESGGSEGKYDNFTHMEFGTGSGTDFKPYYMVAPDEDSTIPQALEGSTSATDGNAKKWDVDILWGKLTYDKEKEDRLLYFKLKHKMSKVTFRFFSNDKEEDGINSKLEGKNVTVKLKNIKTAVYDQRTGANHIPGFRRDKGEIVSTSANDNKSLVTILDDVRGFDGKTKSDGAESDRIYYYAPAYIFPPHNYSAATPKAKLTISLDGEVYSGPFPSTMLYTIEDEAGQEITVSDDMAFLSGYHLIIDVELANNFNNRELLFHGIKVADFKYDFEETNNESRECGIYSLEDLKTLIALYNRLEGNKEDYKLYKYGTFDGEKWIFNLWINIVITESEMETFTKFNNGNFELVLNNYKILKGQGSTKTWEKNDLCESTESSTSPTFKTNMQ